MKKKGILVVLTCILLALIALPFMVGDIAPASAMENTLTTAPVLAVSPAPEPAPAIAPGDGILGAFLIDEQQLLIALAMVTTGSIILTLRIRDRRTTSNKRQRGAGCMEVTPLKCPC